MIKATVLIVEDEEIVAADLSVMLGQLGYTVVGTASEGEEAVEMSCDLKPAVVLMDIRLNGSIDGIEAAEAIRSRYDVPVIYLTAHSDPTTLERAKLSEPFGYILKPFEERELSTTIEMALYKHKSERQLRESQERYRDLVENSNSIIMLVDGNLEITFMNEFGLKFFGYTARELIGKNVVGTTIPVKDDEGRDLAAMAKDIVRHPEQYQENVHKNMRKNGELVWVSWTNKVKYDREGKVLEILAIGNDISHMKKTEEALQKSEREKALILDNADEIIAYHDKDHNIQWANNEYLKSVDMQLAEIKGKKCYHAWGLDRLCEECPVSRVLITGRAERGELTPQNQPHWPPDQGCWMVRAAPVKDNAGNIIGVIEVAIDITERKRTEEALEVVRLEAVREKNRLEAVLEALPVGVSILDSMGGNIRANRAFDEVWGDPRPLPRTVDDYEKYRAWWIETGQQVQPEEWASARAVQRDESVVGQLLRIERFNGNVAYIHNSAAPIHDANGRIDGCAVAIMDISKQIETQEELHRAKEAAEAASRAKSQFLANMSHELRTPMTGVLGMLDIVLLGNLESAQREAIETAHTSASSLVRILNDILDLTKIEKSKFSLDEKPFSLRRSLANTVSMFLPVAKCKGLDLNFTVADNIPETLVGDQTRLNQVITNLTGNSIKFTEKGKVEIGVTTRDSRADDKHVVTFSVTDTGIGIPADKQELIFQSFNQVDQSHTRCYGGSGLGLAISKGIVERMGGTISFTSEEGKGSTFSFTIPFRKAETELAVGFSAESTTPALKAPLSEETTKPRLLVAEDDQTIIQVLCTMFRMAKFEVAFAETGRKAVEMWENGKYDLILMDVQMPRMNGFEASIAIREKERVRGGYIPIIAMTAHAFKEDEKRCLDAGMDAYISKPIDFKACLQLIRDHIK